MIGGFVPLWLFFLASGTLMALLTLIWAVRSRQFDDQHRARYIPLADLSPAELSAAPPARRLPSRVALLVVVLSGALAIVAALAVVLKHS
jgi:cbb3-type cytochrome oxidase maturation protein